MFIVHYCWVQNILYIHHIAPLTNFHVNITYVFIIHYKHSLPASFAFYKHKNIALYANIYNFSFQQFHEKKDVLFTRIARKSTKPFFTVGISKIAEAEIVLTKKYNPCCHTHHRNSKNDFQKRCFLQFVSIFSLLCFTTLIYPLLCFAVPDNIFFVSKLVTYLLYQAMKTNNKIFDISQKRRWRKNFKIYVPRF